MELPIHFRAILEVIGRPKEHVEKSMSKFIENLKKDKGYAITKVDLSEIKKQEGEPEMWSIFAELEIKTAKIEHLTGFCFNYMPSLIEIVEPGKLVLTDVNLSQVLNDLQAKLHQVDLVAKQMKLERDHLRHNLGGLLKNYITLLLKNRNMNSEEISRLTGVPVNTLEDYLDKLIDEGRIDLKEGIYFLKEKK